MCFENIANVGDIVRAYDFQPMADRPECFAEGEVVEKGYISAYGIDGYRIKVLTDTAFPEDPRPEIVAPFQIMFMDFDGRVTKVENV